MKKKIAGYLKQNTGVCTKWLESCYKSPSASLTIFFYTITSTLGINKKYYSDDQSVSRCNYVDAGMCVK